MAVDNDPRVGSIIGAKWRVDALLGSGSMASVYAVTHRNGSRAALKILHAALADDVSVCERFLGEGYLTNSIKHPGIVRVFDDGMTEDGSPFLAMDLLEGVTLDERRTQAGGKLPMFDVIDIADKVMGTLVAVHTAGIIHRDLKPQNVFCENDGGIRLLDFGVARLQERTTQHSIVGMVLGTPSFMSPEQALGGKDVDARSDIWALGAIMFTLLSGETVHVAGTVQGRLLAAASVRARSISTLMPQLPADVILVVDTALQFKKDDRWQTVQAMKNALANVKQSLPPPNLLDSAFDAIRQPSMRPNTQVMPQFGAPNSPQNGHLYNAPNAPNAKEAPSSPPGANPSGLFTSAPPIEKIKGAQPPPRHAATVVGMGPQGAGVQAEIEAARATALARNAPPPRPAIKSEPGSSPNTQRGLNQPLSQAPPTPMMQGAPQQGAQGQPGPPGQQGQPAQKFDPHRAPYESLMPANESSSLPALGNTYPAWAPTPQEDPSAAGRRRQVKIILSVVAMCIAAGVAFATVAFLKDGNNNNANGHNRTSPSGTPLSSAGSPAGSGSAGNSDNELWKQPPPVPYWMKDGGAGRLPQPIPAQPLGPGGQFLPLRPNAGKDAGASDGNPAAPAAPANSSAAAAGESAGDAGTIELW